MRLLRLSEINRGKRALHLSQETGGGVSPGICRCKVIADAGLRSRGAMRPGCASKFPPSKIRAQGMPGARRARGLVCKE